MDCVKRYEKRLNMILYTKLKAMEVTSYYIDDNYVLHTYVGEVKHVTFSNVFSDEEAEQLIKKINHTLN